MCHLFDDAKWTKTLNINSRCNQPLCFIFGNLLFVIFLKKWLLFFKTYESLKILVRQSVVHNFLFITLFDACLDTFFETKQAHPVSQLVFYIFNRVFIRILTQLVLLKYSNFRNFTFEQHIEWNRKSRKIFKFLKLNSYLDLFNNIWIQYNLELDTPGAQWGHQREFHNLSMLNIATSITCLIACSKTAHANTHIRWSFLWQ